MYYYYSTSKEYVRALSYSDPPIICSIADLYYLLSKENAGYEETSFFENPHSGQKSTITSMYTIICCLCGILTLEPKEFSFQHDLILMTIFRLFHNRILKFKHWKIWIRKNKNNYKHVFTMIWCSISDFLKKKGHKVRSDNRSQK